MPDPAAPLKLGANCWNQYTDWPSFLAAHQRAERLGFDSLWTWDHLYPIVGSHEGPIFEGYTAMAAVAANDRPRQHRTDGRRQHVPQPGARGQDGHDARPHQRRARRAGHRCRLVRDRAHGLRHPLRRRPRGAPALARRGAAHHARHARWNRAHRPRERATGPRRRSTCQRRCRRTCPSSSAAAARGSRSSWWRATPTSPTSVAPVRDLAESEAQLVAHCEAVGRDERPSSGPRAWASRSSVTRRRKPGGSSRSSSPTTAAPDHGRSSRSAPSTRSWPTARGSASRATGTSCSGSRRRTTRRP